MMNLHNAEFLKSVTEPRNFIEDPRPQIVFAGKSNVGKSSVLNCVLRRKNFARVGAKPGKTIHINYFLIDEQAYFVDLPGYGYAKVSKTERARWGKLMEQYFAAGLIDLGVMIVDSRHKPTADDCVMADWFKQTGCPVLIVANKGDKLKKSESEPNMAVIRETLGLFEDTEIIPFSAEKGTGRDELLARLEATVANHAPEIETDIEVMDDE
ncbi:MAG: ribosome biogenesis GTP-binding protein YihA/YsxC [Oscillospiraceae bacterium]|nr:ribosome biogenesis GTP-binding protein YihA/YsxC [Oscillospiraceae bacterium]